MPVVRIFNTQNEAVTTGTLLVRGTAGETGTGACSVGPIRAFTCLSLSRKAVLAGLSGSGVWSTTASSVIDSGYVAASGGSELGKNRVCAPRVTGISRAP